MLVTYDICYLSTNFFVTHFRIIIFEDKLFSCIMSQSSCRLELSADSIASQGLYGMAIEIQDFNSQESSTALSQIPLQFLIQVYSSPAPCEDIPALVSPTRECGSCVIIPTGTTYTDQVVARAVDGNRYVPCHFTFIV